MIDKYIMMHYVVHFNIDHVVEHKIAMSKGHFSLDTTIILNIVTSLAMVVALKTMLIFFTF